MSYPPNQPQEPIHEPAAPTTEARRVPVRPVTSRPTVTYAIMGVTVFVYLLQELFRAGFAQAQMSALAQTILGDQVYQVLVQAGLGNDPLIMLGGMIAPLVQAGQIWRLITPAFLHFSLVHIGSNMYSLFVLGPSLERFYGHGRFLALYLLSALGGNILSFYLTRGISAGASTAIFGLIAAQGVFIYQNRSLFGAQARGMLNNIIVVIAINLVLGFSLNFDNWGHLGGLLTGLAFSWFAGPHLAVEPDYATQTYRLVNRTTENTVWMVTVIIFVVLSGLALVRILAV